MTDKKASLAAPRLEFLVKLFSTKRDKEPTAGLMLPSGLILGIGIHTTATFVKVHGVKEKLPLEKKAMAMDDKKLLSILSIQANDRDKKVTECLERAKHSSASHLDFNQSSFTNLDNGAFLWDTSSNTPLHGFFIPMPAAPPGSSYSNGLPNLCFTKIKSGQSRFPGVICDQDNTCVGIQIGEIALGEKVGIFAAPLVSFREFLRPFVKIQPVNEVQEKLREMIRNPSKILLDSNCGCTCDGISCARSKGQLWLMKRNNQCLNPYCKKPRVATEVAVTDIHFMQCHCPAKLPEHMHMATRYFCCSHCERVWKQSPLNEWKDWGKPSDIRYSEGKMKGSYEKLACGGCNAEETTVKFQRCAGCKRQVYCSVVCQKADRAKHKPNCFIPNQLEGEEVD